MPTVDQLTVKLEADTRGLKAGLASARDDVARFDGETTQATGRAASAFRRLAPAVSAAAAALAGLKVAKDLFATGAQVESLNFKMVAATGSAKDAAETLAYLREESHRLGIRFLETAESSTIFLTNMVKAGVPLEEARRIFIKLAESGRAAGLSNSELGRTFYALGQTANVGKLRMEELGGQLGDVLPGALDAAARAMNVSKERLMEMVAAGEVKGIPFIRAFADAYREGMGEAVEQSSRSAQANLNRLINSVDNLKMSVAGGEFMFQLAEGFEAATVAINTPALQQGLKAIATLIATIVRVVAEAIAGIAIMVQKLTEVTGKFAAFVGMSGRGAMGKVGTATRPGTTTVEIPMEIPEFQQVPLHSANLEGGQEETLGKVFEIEQAHRERMLAAEEDYQIRMSEIAWDGERFRLESRREVMDAFLGIQTEEGQRSLADSARNFRATLSQAATHNKAMFQLNKAAAIAEAIVSARQSVVEAYKFGTKLGGPVLGAAFAATAAAAQAANIKAIASASFAGNGGESYAGGEVSSSYTNGALYEPGRTVPAQPRNIHITLNGNSRLAADTVRDLVEQLQEAFDDGVQLKVAS